MVNSIHSFATLSELIAEHDVRPRDPFILFSDGGTISWADHGAAARRVAQRLSGTHGLASGQRVLIMAPTGPDIIAAVSGCWLSGMLAAPVDISTTEQRFTAQLREFKPDLVLLDASLDSDGVFRSAIAQAGSRADDLSRQAGWPEGKLFDTVSPESPALCIFTSGSTGMPKGVVLSHHNMLFGAKNVIDSLALTSSDRAMCVLPLSHLNGMMTTYAAPMLSAGSIVFLRGPFDAVKVLNLIDTHRCTWFSAVPTQYGQLMRPPVEREHWSLESLRLCRSASASLHPRLRADFEEHYGVPIIETMGMTETSAQIFANPLPPAPRKTGSVGLPTGFEVRVVADDGAVCPDHTEGELQIRGSGLMLGYLDNPEETAKAYDGDWLKSGDLGYRDGDGYYFITGRKKDIAIFAGLNISLRHLEEVVLDRCTVSDISCVSEKDDFFGELVVAYVLTSEPETAYSDVAARVQTLLQEELPNRQALKEIRIVDQFPRSSVGKVIKGRLREVKVLYTASRSLTHDPKELLAQVLGLSADTVTDDLALGRIRAWDSLAHAVLVTAVEIVLDRPLSVREILALTSFRGLQHVMKGTLPEHGVEEPDNGIPEDTEAAYENSELISLMVWNGLLPDGNAARTTRAVAPSRGDVLTRPELVRGLYDAGLERGDTVLVHSDISALGLTEAGINREAVLEFYLSAFREALGHQGTLVVCTSFEDYGRYGTPFHKETSPSRLGAFSEFVRTRSGAVRSMHPIVSLTAYGPDAENICNGPHWNGFGYDSPWGRLHRLNAKLMTLGMGRYPEMGLTFIHYIEHLYGVPYQYTKVYRVPVYSDGKEVAGPFTMSVRFLDFGITYDTNPFRDRLLEKKRARSVAVGADCVFCTTCEDAVAVGIECLNTDRYFFLKSPPLFRQGEIPADGPTGEVRYVYEREA